MRFIKKQYPVNFIFIFLLVLYFFSSCKSRSLTDQMVNHKPKERRWNKWRKKREMKNNKAYNPYLEMKTGEKPSDKINAEGKRAIRKAKRAIRKEKRRLRRLKGAYK